MNTTLHYIISSLRGYLPEEELRETALWIAEAATGLSRTEILCKDTLNIPNLQNIIQKIKKQEPLQYIFGSTEWGGLRLQLNRHTLIPRPETYQLVELVCEYVSHNYLMTSSHSLKLLDIGTGSGCIAIALKQRLPQLSVEACDISPQALQIAQQNAIDNHTDIRFFQCNILTDTIPYYDIIVSNPPYVRESEKDAMSPRVLDYEPASALFVPDHDPLLFYQRIARIHAAPHIFFEINEALEQKMQLMLQKENYHHTFLYDDMFGKHRYIHAEQ